MIRKFGSAFAIVALGVATLVSASPAMASGGVHCNSGGDLAAAIASAPSGGSISVDGTCVGNFVINQDLTLNGAATLDGNGSGTTLTVNAASVALNSITVKGGAASGIVNNGGTIKADRSTITGNTAVNGGGIYNNGTVLLNSTTVSGNSATTDGGGIYSTGSGSGLPLPSCGCLMDNVLTLSRATVSGNTAPDGGGIWADSSVKISSSGFSGNTGTYTAPYVGVDVPIALLSVSHSTFN